MGIKHSVTKAPQDKGYASEWNDDHVIDDDVDFNQYQALNFVVENRTDYPVGPVPGQLIFRTDTASLEVWDGTAWQNAAGTLWYFYDEFDGVVIDVAKWTETNAGSGSGVEGGGIVTLSTGNTINSYEQLVSIPTSTIENVEGVEMTVRFKYDYADTTAYYRMGLYLDGTHYILLYLNSGETSTSWHTAVSDGAQSATTQWTINEDEWHVLTISASENTVTFNIDGTSKTLTTNIPATSALNYFLYVRTFAANKDHSLDIDYIRVRHNIG